MVNQIGGKNYKKGKKGGRKTKNPTNQFDTSAGQYLYGQVISKLGHNRLAVKLQTGIEIQAVIPGRFMKKVWIHKEDYVVVNCVNEKFYDVVQKVINQEALGIASNLMGAKIDKDNNDLYNPFINKNNSDDEDDEDSNNQEYSEENENEDDEELLKIANSKLVVNNPTKVSENKLIKKQQDKERDIIKRNRERVFTNTIIKTDSDKSDDTESNDSKSVDDKSVDNKSDDKESKEDEKEKEKDEEDDDEDDEDDEDDDDDDDEEEDEEEDRSDFRIGLSCSSVN